MTLMTRTIAGNGVRVPDPIEGEAVLISRYGRDRAVLLHPEDFQRMQDLTGLAGIAARLPALELSQAAMAAHEDEERPGNACTDPVRLTQLFG